MKKVLLLSGFICVLLCSRTFGQSATDLADKEYYRDPFVKKYMDNPYFIDPELAYQYMGMFRKHAYRGWRKKRLDSAWSRFDTALLKQLLSDNDIDSINFMMAAHLKKRKDTLNKRPFVIVRAMPKKSAYYALSMKGKKILMANAAFFAPLNICPPPDRGCRISQKPNTATLQPDPH